MRLDSVRLSMLLVGVSFACYSPGPGPLRERASRSAVVIEGRVQSAPLNVSAEAYSVNVRVLDVWPRSSGGLEREQLVTVGGEFGPEAACAPVKRNHRYIFFMDPTDEPLVFKASFAPVDAGAGNLKKDVGKVLCEDCAGAPKLKRMKSPVFLEEGSRHKLRCEATGSPNITYSWYKDGSELKKSKDIKIKTSKRNSRVQISNARLEDSGNYTCVVENQFGKSNGTSTVHVQSITTTLSPGSGHARRCNDTEKAYCVNGGDCYFIHGINQLSCKCPNGYFGQRCLEREPLRSYMPPPYNPNDKKAEELYQKRVLTITGICVALLVVGIVCVVAYCKTKKQRKKMHNHLRQNMCVDHPNRNLANGPNHPGPGPEEIPMVDYISKNIPATEQIIQQGEEVSFPGSRASSRTHNSSTHAHSSTHRYLPYITTHNWSQRPASIHHPPWLCIRQEERTWSLERTDSMLSESPSGMMSSSVGTSKCSSPACMEARARRAAHCGLQYGDSFDSLGDSPHSDRYVSALTTPARLSPVGFHYSLPPQVPTFQITSPNASHAMSLPPAARAPYPPEDDQPLLRRYQVPLHDAQRQETYRQQRRTYLNDSTGSLPSSPYRLAEDDEYETTQEYLSSLEQPKRSASGGGRRWRRSRLNGHVAPRGYEAPRDFGSRSCLTDSESEEEEGESTPFLSMQNMNIEPATIYRPADSRTSQSSGRTRGNAQNRQTHPRPKADTAPH
ncbi:neuregulin 2a isoform X7 [Denticeps clupeoides]|uniref:Neuregulin 2a n=1 Tax=Denticeps clupeoides TaxID=299321 RepID=A0AAY4ABP9_9TELE|nr:pro-neuregulin-2, membrane-bound isoform isoform X7 [Denticeps clupeoides]